MFGEDEEGCESYSSSCKNDVFRCPNEMRYIARSWVCDGLADCTSGADELPALCSSTADPSGSSSSPSAMIPDPDGFNCAADEFECSNGQCIPLNLTCDGERQCTDGTDEGLGCRTFLNSLFKKKS